MVNTLALPIISKRQKSQLNNYADDLNEEDSLVRQK